MKISYNWLTDYINLENLSIEKLSEILTDIGLEVEGIEQYESVKGGLEGLIVGEVKTKNKHPDADKLSVTTVDIGNGKILPVVCGAPNVEAGQKVVVATVGTTLYSGDEFFKIKKSKIRGEISEGMICAEDEIGLGTSHDGIMVLDADTPVGMQAKDYFDVKNDTVFEIGLTPNRVDSASHIGVARDLAAYLKQKNNIDYQKPAVDTFKPDNTNKPFDIIVENHDACPRYSGLTITGISIKESPEWLQNRLKAIGLNPINNVVDITNFVLHEIGQPLHAFDADKITGEKVIVKTLPENTAFTTLDEVERKLSGNDLMICNQDEGMCIAGVFGGAKSGVTETTKNIFLESAYFNPVWVRKTAKRHGLSTDSSFRFERGIDPNSTVFALKRAALLIKELAGGEISSEITDIYPKPITDFTVEVSFQNIYRLIGLEINEATIRKIIASLEMKIQSETAGKMTLSVPSYRVDVQREADVIEDILRIYGYNKIDIPASVHSSLSYATPTDKNHKIKEKVSSMLVGAGFNEIMCLSMNKEEYYDDLKTFPKETGVKIYNPLSADLNIMRQTLLFGGLETVIYNINRKQPDLKLFEFGNSYFNRPSEFGKYTEKMHLGLWTTGNKSEENWNTPPKKTDIYHLKAHVNNILKALNFDVDAMDEKENSDDIFAYSLELYFNKKLIAQIGLVHKQLLKILAIEQEVYFADIHWYYVLENIPERAKYKEIPKFPEVRRDLSLLLDDAVTFGQLKESAFKTERKLLRKVGMFDLYKGKNIEVGKKSYALSFILRDDYKTLTDKQIDKAMKKIMSNYQRQFNATVR